MASSKEEDVSFEVISRVSVENEIHDLRRECDQLKQELDFATEELQSKNDLIIHAVSVQKELSDANTRLRDDLACARLQIDVYKQDFDDERRDNEMKSRKLDKAHKIIKRMENLVRGFHSD